MGDVSTMRKPATLACLISLLVVLPFIGALTIVADARYNRYFGDRIDYLKHAAPGTSYTQVIQRLGYKVHDVNQDGVPVPRRFLSGLPANLPKLPVSERKEIFTATLLPLVLRVNELIRQDRTQLTDIAGRWAAGAAISRLEEQWTVQLARSYEVGTPSSIDQVDFQELFKRVDVVPPSLAVAQAAIESGWGTSRFARQGNALYGQWMWGSGKGIVPAEREDGKNHKIRSFDYLMQSVYTYVHNLNTHPAYADFREMRLRQGLSEPLPPSQRLADALTAYSERGSDYVQEVKLIIRSNGLSRIDSAQLEPDWWSSP